MKMTEERMAMIDKEITASNAREFGTHSSARSHFSKEYTHQWCTEERANNFEDRISAACRCCDDGEDEMILQRFTKNMSKPIDDK